MWVILIMFRCSLMTSLMGQVSLITLTLAVGELNSGSSARRLSDVDFDMLFRVGDKLLKVLQKKCKDCGDAYMVLVLMVLFFEECAGCKLDVEGWNELRSVVAEAWKGNDSGFG
jgi:hypothetical protein